MTRKVRKSKSTPSIGVLFLAPMLLHPSATSALQHRPLCNLQGNDGGWSPLAFMAASAAHAENAIEMPSGIGVAQDQSDQRQRFRVRFLTNADDPRYKAWLQVTYSIFFANSQFLGTSAEY
jgi:hypothetical protein